jgi:biotin synthase
VQASNDGGVPASAGQVTIRRRGAGTELAPNV